VQVTLDIEAHPSAKRRELLEADSAELRKARAKIAEAPGDGLIVRIDFTKSSSMAIAFRYTSPTPE